MKVFLMLILLNTYTTLPDSWFILPMTISPVSFWRNWLLSPTEGYEQGLSEYEVKVSKMFLLILISYCSILLIWKITLDKYILTNVFTYSLYLFLDNLLPSILVCTRASIVHVYRWGIGLTQYSLLELRSIIELTGIYILLFFIHFGLLEELLKHKLNFLCI